MKLALLAAAAAALAPVQTLAVPRAAGVTAFGDTLYVRAGVGSTGELHVYARSPRTGRLTQIQCVARRAKACADGRGLETPSALAVSPDGRSVYVAALNGRSVGVASMSATATASRRSTASCGRSRRRGCTGRRESPRPGRASTPSRPAASRFIGASASSSASA